MIDIPYDTTRGIISYVQYTLPSNPVYEVLQYHDLSIDYHGEDHR